MLLADFCKKYKVTGVRKTEDGDHEIAGNSGSVYVYSDTLFAAHVSMESEAGWTRRKKALLATSCKVLQDGDWEGVVLFDPSDSQASRAVRKACGLRKARTISDDQMEVLKKRLADARNARTKSKKDSTLS